jgi:hypothetical protein
MLALERHRKLIECLNARGSVRTVEVAAELGCSVAAVKPFESPVMAMLSLDTFAIS